MRDTNDGSWVLDASAHLLSRALVSQSASVTCCTLARVLLLFVLRINIVFMVYCVNVKFRWSKLLVFIIRYTNGVLKHGRWTSQAGRPERWCIKCSVTSSIKQMPACQSTMLPKCKNILEVCSTSIESVQRIIRERNVAICISLSACHMPSFVSVTLL
jgi:hypothetical protein